MNNLQAVEVSGPIPPVMVIGPNSATEKESTIPVVKRDLEYFKREVGKHTLALWRSTKRLADVLVDARLNLSPEDFQQLLSEAQISYSWFAKLVKEASNYRMNDPANGDLLPETFSVRYEIMLLKETTFRLGVSKGIIHKNCTLADVRKLREQVEGKKGKQKSATAEDVKQSSTAELASASMAAVEPEAKADPEPKLEGSEATDSDPTVAVADTNNTATEASVAAAAARSESKSPEPKRVAVKAASVKPTPLQVVPVRSSDTDKHVVKSRIAVYIAAEVANKNQDQLPALRKAVQEVVAKFPFIETVEFSEVAA